MVRCQADGTWDFGDLRCEGPVCTDPGRPADGAQKATSYEQGSKVRGKCEGGEMGGEAGVRSGFGMLVGGFDRWTFGCVRGREIEVCCQLVLVPSRDVGRVCV